MELVIGNKNYSSWSLRPWLLMSYFNLSFQEQIITLFTADMIDKMTDTCPNFRVPVLLDSDIKVWDSLAICEYINEQYLANKAWPNDIKQRALARSICNEMHANFADLRHELPMNCRRKQYSIGLSENCQKDISRILVIWQECLENNEGEFLFGEFSIADAYYMPVVVRFDRYLIEVNSTIRAYMTRMLSLPAFQQWQQAAEKEVEVIDCEER